MEEGRENAAPQGTGTREAATVGTEGSQDCLAGEGAIYSMKGG